MRLIDADELIKLFEKKLFDSEVMCPIVKMTDVLEIIYNQPTAYDVEKVVEQIKEWSFEAEIVIPQSDGYDDTTTKEIICTQIAIEIVKEGGAE